MLNNLTEINSEKVTINVSCNTLNKLYTTIVYNDICIGELIRNCCVNLGIDPDTDNGITKNINVKVSSGQDWEYNPYISLFQAGLRNEVNLSIEPIYPK
mmetsp:Transcript_177/g.168  ORF Transcript_177/g.168 Transcript_177/m.168 type:complete len:99 (+) Transcript_177:393-689(+)